MPSQDELRWFAIEVDGEAFEWCAVEGMMVETDASGRRTRRNNLFVSIRRPGSERHSFGISYDHSHVVGEASLRDAVRRWRDTTSLAFDWRPEVRDLARKLATHWGRLPFDAQRALAQTWLERCERRRGKALVVEDSNDLHEVSAASLQAAREVGLAEGMTKLLRKSERFTPRSSGMLDRSDVLGRSFFDGTHDGTELRWGRQGDSVRF